MIPVHDKSGWLRFTCAGALPTPTREALTCKKGDSKNICSPPIDSYPTKARRKLVAKGWDLALCEVSQEENRQYWSIQCCLGTYKSQVICQ